MQCEPNNKCTSASRKISLNGFNCGPQVDPGSLPDVETKNTGHWELKYKNTFYTHGPFYVVYIYVLFTPITELDNNWNIGSSFP